MLGALIAAGFAAKFAPSCRIPLRSLFAAVVGGAGEADLIAAAITRSGLPL